MQGTAVPVCVCNYMGGGGTHIRVHHALRMKVREPIRNIQSGRDHRTHVWWGASLPQGAQPTTVDRLEKATMIAELQDDPDLCAMWKSACVLILFNAFNVHRCATVATTE